MVKGCQKKMIYVKNTDSDIFEEAYLVMKDSGMYDSMKECDLVKEATRMLDESFAYNEDRLSVKIKGFMKTNLPPFCTGAALSALTALLIILL